MHKLHFALSAMLVSSIPATALAQAAPAAALQPATILVERDTIVRLMVLNEVSTRTAKPGDRFILRVDEDVVVAGATVIPVGTKAWGEVLSADSSGTVGKAGKLAARLLFLDVGGVQVPISGENKSTGAKGGNQVVLAALALGPFALLARGNNAKLKAGDIFSAFLESDLQFDPATSKLSLLPGESSAAPAQ